MHPGGSVSLIMKNRAAMGLVIEQDVPGPYTKQDVQSYEAQCLVVDLGVFPFRSQNKSICEECWSKECKPQIRSGNANVVGKLLHASNCSHKPSQPEKNAQLP